VRLGDEYRILPIEVWRALPIVGRAAPRDVASPLMPKGPQGQRRPSDVIGAAVKVMRIATGEEAEDSPGPTSAAAQLGKLGGAARARNLTADQRKEIARKAAAKRWGRD